MPNIQSAKKRMRQAAKARARNRSVKSRIATARGKLFDACASRAVEAAQQAFRNYCSVLDKAAKSGVIKKNTAIRRKRRAAAKLAAVSTAAPGAAPASA